MSKAGLDDALREAVRRFWRTRSSQGRRQGAGGTKDKGSRSMVTGGKQLDGFRDLAISALTNAGIELTDIQSGRDSSALPGWFRPAKSWDLVVVRNGVLLACLEFKSQVGSFGNNFNNRTEEAIGSAVDLWTAFREGRLSPSPQPWLGYLAVVEDCEESSRPVSAKCPHFPLDPEFVGTSYQQRYEQLCLRLVRERLYSAAALLVTPRGEGAKQGASRQPNAELKVARFMQSLRRHCSE